jgi:HAD superfamily hydrolase (TIGR01493 family)
MTDVTPRAYVFDAYGTLFDVHAAIARHRGAAGPDAERFSEIWRAKQLKYAWILTLAGRYADFWTLTERALDYAFARVPSVDRALRPKLLEAYFTLDAFADAPAAVAALKARGSRIAILSNGSPHMLEAISHGPRSMRWSPTAFGYGRTKSCSYRRAAGTSWEPRHSASGRYGSTARGCPTNTPKSRRCVSWPI